MLTNRLQSAVKIVLTVLMFKISIELKNMQNREWMNKWKIGKIYLLLYLSSLISLGREFLKFSIKLKKSVG